jgi:tryptophanyl-tRNA synthetase
VSIAHLSHCIEYDWYDGDEEEEEEYTNTFSASASCPFYSPHFPSSSPSPSLYYYTLSSPPGMDQRKVNMLAREYAKDKKKRFKPVIISHHMLMGLKEGQEKMSKSDVGRYVSLPCPLPPMYQS